MKSKSKKKASPRRSSTNSKLARKILVLQRQVLVLENLRKRRLQKNSINSGEIKILAMGISHEFNNILGAVDGHAEWALESSNPQDWRASLEIIRLACERSSEITSALRGWGQPREEHKTVFPISEVFYELKAILAPSLKNSGVALELPKNSTDIYGNKTEILEVVLNIVKNAVEALSMARSAEPKSIVLKCSNGKNFLSLDVLDNGPGIPEIYRDKVFEPFFTMKGVLAILNTENKSGSEIPVMAPKGSGSGLGLFLSRSIIEEHGGTLTLQPAKIGTHFKINLPLTEV